MKHRNPGAVFLLSIVTFGIYDLYWLYKTKQVLNQQTKFHTPSLWLLVGPVVVLVAAYIVLAVSLPQSSTNSSNPYGGGYYATTTTSSNAHITHPAAFFASLAVVIISWLVWFFVSAFWFFRFSKAVNEYTRGHMSTAVAFLVLWLIHLIGVVLVQDAFNDVHEDVAPTAPQPPVPPAAPIAPHQPPAHLVS